MPAYEDGTYAWTTWVWNFLLWAFSIGHLSGCMAGSFLPMLFGDSGIFTQRCLGVGIDGVMPVWADSPA